LTALAGTGSIALSRFDNQGGTMRNRTDVTLEDIAAEMARLQQENEGLRARLARLEDGSGATRPDGTAPVTRRAMLRRAGAAAAAGAGLAMASTALGARPARAAAGTMMYGTQNHAGDSSTLLDSTFAGYTLQLENNNAAGLGTALLARTDSNYAAVEVKQDGDGDGLKAEAGGGSGSAAVRGIAYGSTDAVHGATDSEGIDGVAVHAVARGFCYGLKAEISKAENGRPAIWGIAGAGEAILGESTSGAGVIGKATTSGSGVVGRAFQAGDGVSGISLDSGRGVFGQSDTGVAVHGDIQNGQSGATAVKGSTLGGGAGIAGSSRKGRGAVFSGKLAQVRLRPSGEATHPIAGAAGDLFLDASSRLWLCTGTGSPATWKRVQLV